MDRTPWIEKFTRPEPNQKDLKHEMDKGSNLKTVDQSKLEKKSISPDVPENTQASTQQLCIKEQRSNNLRIPAGRKALGYKVYTAWGDYLGRVVSVMNNADAEHYAVKEDSKRKTYDVRATEDSFMEIDAESKKMVVIKWK